MNRKLKIIIDDYIKNNGIYEGSYPNVNTSDISNEDIILHTRIKTASGINDLLDINKYYLSSLLSSINIIKWLMIFWSILGAIGIIFNIISTIKIIKYLP
ncbi:MAG TPA: hypothetical protein GXX20_07110 [Clostridiaceae bacterium]|nr:hypothetical protein [Clostridiaceae bacterium]